MIPGPQRPNTSLSCLRFVPSIAQILLSRDWVEESPRTVVGAFGIATFRTIAAFAFDFWTFVALALRLVPRPARIWVGILSVFVIAKFVIRFAYLFPYDYVFS